MANLDESIGNLRTLIDPGYSARLWQEATAMVIQGKAAATIGKETEQVARRTPVVILDPVHQSPFTEPPRPRREEVPGERFERLADERRTCRELHPAETAARLWKREHYWIRTRRHRHSQNRRDNRTIWGALYPPDLH